MVTTSAINIFVDLCNPSCTSLSVSPSEEDWRAVTELSQRHGLIPFFLHRLRSLGITLPEDLKRKWIMAYLYQMGQERKARQQIKGLKEILEPAGIPFILLKGASAMLRLYPKQGLRSFCDIDILIPPEQTNRFKKLMSEAGYKQSVILNSPEEEEVWKFESHLPAIKKDDSLPIEAHLSILGRKEKMCSSAISEPGTGPALQAEPACSKLQRRQVGGEKSDGFLKGVDIRPKAGGSSVESASPDSTEIISSSASFASRTRPWTSSGRVGGEAFISSFSLWNELWQDSEETEIDGTKVYHLGKEHFVIHMLLHFDKHLRMEGNLEIKSLVDLLHAVRTWTIDWERLWDQARRWKIEGMISPVVATLNHQWQMGVPISEKIAPLYLVELIPREEELQRAAIQRVPAGFLHRLSKAGELPGFGSRVRFLFHIFFPTRGNLYWRYGFSTEKTITSYYWFHLSEIGKRFFRGVGLSIARIFQATSTANTFRSFETNTNQPNQITKSTR